MTKIAEIRQDLALLQARASSLDAALLDVFIDRLSRWLDDDSTAEELVANLDRTLGHTWFSSEDVHATVAQRIARLRDTVATVGGMTMNERLVVFDLLDRWDHSSNAERDVLYKKVHAKR